MRLLQNYAQKPVSHLVHLRAVVALALRRPRPVLIRLRLPEELRALTVGRIQENM